MNNVDLKTLVFQKLETANDALLEEILEIIDIEMDKDKVVPIPSFFKDELDKGIAEMEAGNVVSNKEAEASIEKWLYK